MHKSLNNKTKLATLGAIASLATLPTIGVFAATGTTVTDTVEVTIDSACTITTTNLSNTYSATMTNGQLKSDFGSTNMTINCNDAGGWHLTAVGTGADASDKTVMNATNTGTDIATGTATSGNTSNWAMKVTGTGATGFTTFQPIPSVATNVAGDSNPVANATLNTTYQVFISSTQQADTYTGQVTYTLAHPYEQAPPPPTYYMQDVADWEDELDEGDEIVAKDRRDGTEYTVARLADNKIWMTQNLDFDITNNGADLDSTNTDVPDNWGDAGKLANTYTTGTTTWNSSNTTPESYDPGDLYWNGAIINDQTTCEANGGTWQPWGSCDGANTTSSIGDSHYRLGNYYNWTAAVAMSDSTSYTSGDVDQSICPAGWMLPKSSSDQTGPGSFQYLIGQAGLSAGANGNIQNSPVYFVYGGYWNGNFAGVTRGSYWSSISPSNSQSFYLDFYATGLIVSEGVNERKFGFSVRCVAR